MSSQVVVAFGKGSEYTFTVGDSDVGALDRESAHRWLDRQLSAMDCVPDSPVGKTLLVDKVLNVAKYAGEARFAGGGDWPRRYAAAVSRLVDRPVVRVDVGELLVG
jgi:hypothetical protein